MKNSVYKFKISTFSIFVFLLFTGSLFAQVSQQEFYQIKIYNLDNQEQESIVDNYLEHVYLPALHRAGIPSAGFFKPVASDENAGKLIYVFIPFKSLDQFLKLPENLQKDEKFKNADSEYINASYENPPFGRIESILLKAFFKFPACKVPEFTTSPVERVYELRSYEGPTEQYFTKKVHMFNQGGETDIFKRLEFQPVFFAEVISGSHMPNLMYMTSFSNKDSRDEHWKKFGEDPEWIKLKAMEEYHHTVSKADIFFLYPTAYSDF